MQETETAATWFKMTSSKRLWEMEKEKRKEETGMDEDEGF